MVVDRGSTALADRLVDLIGVINQECVVLEHLVFKLHEAELLGAAGNMRFMGMMTDEIDAAASELGSTEITRALLAADLTHKLGIDSDATLAEIAGVTPGETSSTLLEARERLVVLTRAVERFAKDAEAVVSERLEHVAATVAEMEDPAAPGHDPYRRTRPAPPPASFQQRI